MKRTKIVCTIGPASEKKPVLEKMIRAGMNVARLNFSHGTYTNHRLLIRNIRAMAKKVGVPIALLADLQGPKVRVGILPKEGLELKAGSRIVFRADTESMKGEIIPIPYADLAKDLKRGDRILLDDGLLEVEVTAIHGRDIETKVIVGGKLTSHKGFNVPTASLAIPAVTKKDLEDLRFALGEGVDFVALSFVKSASDVDSVRRSLNKKKKDSGVKIIVKIEKHEAVKNFDAILKVADGIMIARGDLGIETPAEDVPILQKQFIEKCLRAAKPVIVATQMLDSMIRNPRPTRAEVSDVANAVVDHTDAVMLSGESASGKYPVEAITIMAKIAKETEASSYDDLKIPKLHEHERAESKAVSELAALIAKATDAKLIVVTTISGATARFISHLRPEIPIIALTNDPRVCRQLVLSWGVFPIFVSNSRTLSELLHSVNFLVKKNKLAKHGDKIILVTCKPLGHAGIVNTVKIVKL